MPCVICGRSDAQENFGGGVSGWQYDCPRCGRYMVNKSHTNCFIPDGKCAVASHLVRNMQSDDETYFPELTDAFFSDLKHRSLPSPAELMNNLIRWIAKNGGERPGRKVPFDNLGPVISALVSEVGGESKDDLYWAIDNLSSSRIVERYDSLNDRRLPDAIGTSNAASDGFDLSLTASGWHQYEQLMKGDRDSKYAFFARQFENPELDEAYDKSLCSAVKATGYELRPATQRAGLIDAIIEDEIRRCRFMIADLSDDNQNAYWEAGFAEGLGKPVIYICKAIDKNVGSPKKTKFDTDHRHTIWWDLSSLDETAKNLKAVIRNTLLGDANQSDE